MQVFSYILVIIAVLYYLTKMIYNAVNYHEHERFPSFKNKEEYDEEEILIGKIISFIMIFGIATLANPASKITILILTSLISVFMICINIYLLKKVSINQQKIIIKDTVLHILFFTVYFIVVYFLF